MRLCSGSEVPGDKILQQKFMVKCEEVSKMQKGTSRGSLLALRGLQGSWVDLRDQSQGKVGKV